MGSLEEKIDKLITLVTTTNTNTNNTNTYIEDNGAVLSGVETATQSTSNSLSAYNTYEMDGVTTSAVIPAASTVASATSADVFLTVPSGHVYDIMMVKAYVKSGALTTGGVYTSLFVVDANGNSVRNGSANTTAADTWATAYLSDMAVYGVLRLTAGASIKYSVDNTSDVATATAPTIAVAYIDRTV